MNEPYNALKCDENKRDAKEKQKRGAFQEQLHIPLHPQQIVD